VSRFSDTLPPKVEDLRDRIRDFVHTTVLPAEPPPGDYLAPAELTRLRRAAREAGVFAPQSPTLYGGQGIAIRYWSPLMQEAGYSPIGPAVLNCMAPDEGNMHLLHLVGDNAQKARYLAPLVAGEISSCFAMTEPHPGAGSDPAMLTTAAVRTDDGWSITGSKRFISGAEGAQLIIVMARTPQWEGYPAGATMFLVPSTSPGVRIGGHPHMFDRAIVGGHPYVDFDSVTVGDDAVLGTPGAGFHYAQARLAPARLTHCMRWLGLARRALDIALDRVNHRTLFGSHLRDLGLAQQLVSDSIIDLETSDAIITKTALILERDPRAGSALSSVAKVHCSEAIHRIIDRSMQLCGGDGMSNELPLAQYLNEVRPFRVYDGSNETHRWAIARRAARDRARRVTDGAARMDVVAAPQPENM
jgi:acyl-CoA dehydrogenase